MFKLIVLVVAIASSNALPRTLNPKLRGMDGRIVGGDDTTIEEHPWQVTLRGDFGGYYCAGSLISNNTIVTSAQCGQYIVLGRDKVIVGTTYLSESGAEFAIASVVVNDKFDPSEISSDIAVVKLEGEVEFSDQVQIVKLPEQGNIVADGTEVTVAGWGTDKEFEYHVSDVLKEVQVNIVGKKECEEAYERELPDTMICAGASGGGKDACWGDAGSPLTADGVLYGIVSWGHGCAESKYPGVYANVANLRDWIKENSGV